MNNINVKQLVGIVADKLDLTFDTDNFKDFRKFVEDIYPQLVTGCDSFDDMVYRSGEVTCTDIHVRIDTNVLKAVFLEADEKFGMTDGDAEFYSLDESDRDDDEYTDVSEIASKRASVNYAPEKEVSMAETLTYWQNVCARYGGEIEVEIGLGDENTYCKHDLKWRITADKIESQNSYLEIVDDSGRDLMFGLYWLIENFYFDTFEGFEKLGVELRYEQRG